MPRTMLPLILMVLLVAASGAHAQPQTWEHSRATGGEWSAVHKASAQTGATTQTAPDPTLDRVEKLLAEKRNKEAKRLAIEWVLANRTHPQRDRGLYLIAQSLYQYGNRLRAFYYLDELLDTYPDSAYYGAALEKQYQIADAYLNGYKRRFFGVPMFHAYDEGIEMLFRIQHRSPGSQLAERALLRTANFYYHDEQYDFAADTYGAYLRSYPRSPITPRVRLRQAYSMYAQFRGPRFDASPAIDAREQLRELIAQYEDLAKEENLPQLVERIDRTLAHKLYVTADFYRRTKEPVGAAYTYRYVAKAYPETEEARAAEVALKALPEWALQSVPDPAIMPAYAPATPPGSPRMIPAAHPIRPGVFEKSEQTDRPTFR